MCEVRIRVCKGWRGGVRGCKARHVLDESARVPPSGVIDARLAPDTACAVEVEEVARTESRILLALDVRIEADLLVSAEETLVRVEVGPPPLHEAHLV